MKEEKEPKEKNGWMERASETRVGRNAEQFSVLLLPDAQRAKKHYATPSKTLPLHNTTHA